MELRYFRSLLHGYALVVSPPVDAYDEGEYSGGGVDDVKGEVSG